MKEVGSGDSAVVEVVEDARQCSGSMVEWDTAPMA